MWWWSTRSTASRDRSPTSPGWSSCSISTGCRSSRSPRPLTPPPAWGG
jgi:hypothetical protein